MQYRTLGSTGKQVSRIGLGLAALGRPGYINLGRKQDFDDRSEAAMQARCHAVLDAAYASGIRYFDAARSYGLSEVFLAKWLADNPAPDCTIGSKWGYAYTAGWTIDAPVHEQKEHSVDRLRQQWAESRAILGDRIDLYQIHSATLESGVLDRRDVLSELARLKQQGVAIGLSVSGPKQSDVIDRAIDIAVDGVRLFDTVQATWNLMERSAGSALQHAHDSGMGVIIKEGVANGRLTSSNPALPAALMDAARSVKIEPDAAALAAILAQEWVDVVLSGAATIAQLHSNLAAIEKACAIEWETVIRPSTAEQYWSERSALPWS